MVGIAFERKRLISEVERCFFCRIGIIPLHLLNLVIDSYERRQRGAAEVNLTISPTLQRRNWKVTQIPSFGLSRTANCYCDLLITRKNIITEDSPALTSSGLITLGSRQ